MAVHSDITSRIAQSWRSTLRRLRSGRDEEFPAALRASRTLLERILVDNVLPFWWPEVLDTEQGGYRVSHDLGGNWDNGGDKYLVAQARTLWSFARLAQSQYGRPEFQDAAQHGFLFLQQHMWDAQAGGFFWQVDPAGTRPIVAEKRLFGQAFALFALSEYAKIAPDGQVRGLADSLFAVLEKAFLDPKYGGYHETPQTAVGGTRGSKNAPRPMKTMNSHLHLLEAMIPYCALSNHSQARARLSQLTLILTGTVVRNQHQCTDMHATNWTPISEGGQRSSYGHDIENIHLLIAAYDYLQVPTALHLDFYQTLFRNAYRWGYDRRKGGFFESGLLGRTADRRKKSWWVQAECLLGALAMYKLTDDPFYGDCFMATLDWVVRHQIDWRHGEWHAEILPNGKPNGAKVGPWKTPYHTTRALLQCIELLDTLPED